MIKFFANLACIAVLLAITLPALCIVVLYGVQLANYLFQIAMVFGGAGGR